jgi:hypothetical protein
MGNWMVMSRSVSLAEPLIQLREPELLAVGVWVVQEPCDRGQARHLRIGCSWQPCGEYPPFVPRGGISGPVTTAGARRAVDNSLQPHAFRMLAQSACMSAMTP